MEKFDQIFEVCAQSLDANKFSKKKSEFIETQASILVSNQVKFNLKFFEQFLDEPMKNCGYYIVGKNEKSSRKIAGNDYNTQPEII